MMKYVWADNCFWKFGWSGYRRWFAGAFLLLTCLTGISGCGSSDGRLAISGRVTVDGEPLDGAAINFQPAPGTSGHSSGGPVKAGVFRVSSEKGLMPGTYRVTIIAMKKTGRMIEDPQKGRVPELVQVRFRKIPGEVTAVAGESNEFQFSLDSVL